MWSVCLSTAYAGNKAVPGTELPEKYNPGVNYLGSTLGWARFGRWVLVTFLCFSYADGSLPRLALEKVSLELPIPSRFYFYPGIK